MFSPIPFCSLSFVLLTRSSVEKKLEVLMGPSLSVLPFVALLLGSHVGTLHLVAEMFLLSYFIRGS